MRRTQSHRRWLGRRCLERNFDPSRQPFSCSRARRWDRSTGKRGTPELGILRSLARIFCPFTAVIGSRFLSRVPRGVHCLSCRIMAGDAGSMGSREALGLLVWVAGFVLEVRLSLNGSVSLVPCSLYRHPLHFGTPSRVTSSSVLSPATASLRMRDGFVRLEARRSFRLSLVRKAFF